MKKTLLAAIVLTFVLSCDDHEHSAATITVTSPTEGQVVALNGQIGINAVITSIDGSELHGYEYYVRNKAAEGQVCSNSLHEHGPSFTISDTCNITFPSGSEGEVVITSINDHEGNTTVKRVSFTVN